MIPPHACWWPITGAVLLLVEGTDGALYQVPDTHDTVPRDYDHALSIPHDDQRAIALGRDDAWPVSVDPKCIVVVRARGQVHAGAPANCTYWFVRLSNTPQILRRVPASVRARLRTSLLQCAAFTHSTLITEYMDSGTEFSPTLQGWARYDGHGNRGDHDGRDGRDSRGGCEPPASPGTSLSRAATWCSVRAARRARSSASAHRTR